MRNTLFITCTLVGLATLLGVFQGCSNGAGSSNTQKLSSSNVQAAPAPVSGAPPNSEAAASAADVAYYYEYSQLHSSANFTTMLNSDGGCQMAADFANAINGNNLANSVVAYCATAQLGTCANAQSDAQRLVADVQSLITTCAVPAGSDNPYIFGNLATADDLIAVMAKYRADLSLPAAQ